MKIVYTKQTDLKDCGVSCLMSIVRYYGGYVRREYVREITNTSKDGVSIYSMVEASEKLGLEAIAINGNIKDISNKLPVIAHVLINNSFGHFIIISSINSKYITVMDPNSGFRKYTFDEYNNITTNNYILFKPKSNIIKQIKEESIIKLIFNILKKYKSTFIYIFIFSFIYAILNVLLSYGIEIFLNINKNKIYYMFIIFIFLLLIKELSNLFRNNLVNYLNHSLDKTLIHDVYSHIIRLPYSYFKCRKKGDIYTRIEDILKIRDVICKCIVTLIIDSLFIIITLLAMFNIHKKLTILLIIITLIYIIIVLIYSKYITKKIKNIKEDEVSLNNHIMESLSSIDSIKGMQLEKYLENKLSIKHNKLLSSSFDLNKLYFKENFIKEILYGIGTLLILLIGSLNHFMISKLMVYYILMTYYFTPIINICNLQLLIRDASISFIRIKELLNVEEEKSLSNKIIQATHLSGYITFNRLKYSYNGISNILECDNLTIKAGDKVLLYGESGGGKSTLMKILARYLSNYNGDIKLDNNDLNDYDLSFIRQKITYVSQEEVIYTDTLYNNIVLDKNISYKEYKNIINLTGVSNIFKRSLFKDEMMLDNNASNLSGGEKQRIILSRSLVKKSDIYIFDESFSALDLESETKLIKNIFNYLKDKTVIVISHRFNNKDLYQKYILIEKGKVYEC